MIPFEAFEQHSAIVGRTGSGKDRICRHCGKAFKTRRPSDKGFFCSVECHSDAKRILPIPKPKECEWCSKEFQPRAKRPRQRFCSRGCGIKAVNPPNHNARVSRASAKARGDKQRGRGAGKGYRKFNGRHEHRVVMEQELGRPLQPGEIVHHRDEIKLNNEPSNLRLTDRPEHMRLHGLGIPGVRPSWEPWKGKSK